MPRVDATVRRMEPEEAEFSAAAYACPACGQDVAAPADPSANLLVCPSCGNQFFVGATDDDDVPAEQASAPAPAPADDELDGLRIRQLSAVRRSAFRARSYLLIGGLL